MPVQGFASFRKWGFGAQTVHGTAVNPSRAVAWGGVLDVNPNWTDQEDVDVGSIDPILPPFRLHTDVTAPLSGQLQYNDIPLIMAAGLRGGVSPSASSTSRTWIHAALSLTPTTLDVFSGQWGDDVTADGFRMWDGIEESVELGFDETLGPWMYSGTWRFGSINPRVTPVPLFVGSNPILVFGADTALFIDDTSGGIGGTQITNALRAATLTIEPTIDAKRYANGSNTRFAVAGYGLTARQIRLSVTFDKADAIVAGGASEMAKWLSADPVSRYIQLVTTSPSLAAAGIPYSWTQNLHGEWRTRSDGEVGGNSTVTLEGVARYSSGLGHAYRSTVINTQTALP